MERDVSVTTLLAHIMLREFERIFRCLMPLRTYYLHISVSWSFKQYKVVEASN